MQPKRIKWRLAILPIIGAILTVFGATLAIHWENIFQTLLARELTLSPTSRTFSIWKEPPVDIFIDFYFFNWTNPESISNDSIKPHFDQMGPYRFRETKEKVNITWNKHNSTVSFRHLRRWYFDSEHSNGTLSDNVTTVNVIAASAAYTTRFWSSFMTKGLSVGLLYYKQEISVTKTVGQFLFEGYDDPLIDLGKSIPGMQSMLPPVDRFGWFYKRNGSIENDGYFNMATGAININSFGELKVWNNVTQTHYYPSTCGKVEGSAGEFYPPRQTKTKKVSMFSPDLCRSISFDFDEEVNINGVQGYRYSGTNSIVDNGTMREENKCFCTGECQPSGALNVSTCRYGSPAFVSLPHFYSSDPYYTNAIDGLSPEKEKHDLYIALEPMSGVPIDVAARFQINILISTNKRISLYRNTPKLYLPVLWFEQRVSLNDHIAEELKMLLMVPSIGNITSIVIFVIGIILILWTPLKINIKSWYKKRAEEKHNEHYKTISKHLRTNKNAKKPNLNYDFETIKLKCGQSDLSATEPLNAVNLNKQ